MSQTGNGQATPEFPDQDINQLQSQAYDLAALAEVLGLLLSRLELRDPEAGAIGLPGAFVLLEDLDRRRQALFAALCHLDGWEVGR